MPPSRFTIVCSICREELLPDEAKSHPVVVSCGHIFCADDLKRYKASSRKGCPICRETMGSEFRLYPHIDNDGDDLHASTSSPAAAPVDVEGVMARIEKTTANVRKASDELEVGEAMEIVTGVNRTILELNVRQESKVMRALKPLHDEVHRLLKRVTRHQQDVASSSVLQQRLKELQQQYEESCRCVEDAMRLKVQQQDRATELEAKLSYLKLKYQHLKAQGGGEAIRTLENENKVLRTKLRLMEKENKKLRKPNRHVEDPSLEVYAP